MDGSTLQDAITMVDLGIYEVRVDASTFSNQMKANEARRILVWRILGLSATCVYGKFPKA